MACRAWIDLHREGFEPPLLQYDAPSSSDCIIRRLYLTVLPYQEAMSWVESRDVSVRRWRTTSANEADALHANMHVPFHVHMHSNAVANVTRLYLSRRSAFADPLLRFSAQSSLSPCITFYPPARHLVAVQSHTIAAMATDAEPSRSRSKRAIDIDIDEQDIDKGEQDGREVKRVKYEREG